MIKKTITYETFDGEKITEEFCFHLSKAEIAEFEIEHNGGLADHMRAIASTSDTRQVMPIFKALIAKTVGVQSADGKRFIKTDEIRDNFMQSDAYSELFMQLIQDLNFAIAFMSGIVPKNIGAEVGPQMQQQIEKFRAAPGSPAMTGITDLIKEAQAAVDSPEGWKPTGIKNVVKPGDNLTIKEVSLDPVGLPHTSAEVVTPTGEIQGVSFMGQIVDETTATSTEIPAKGIGDFSRNELLSMDDATFYALAGNDAQKWSKVVLGVAMARRANSDK